MREAARPVGRARDRSPDGEGTRPTSPSHYAAFQVGASAERPISRPIFRALLLLVHRWEVRAHRLYQERVALRRPHRDQPHIPIAEDDAPGGNDLRFRVQAPEATAYRHVCVVAEDGPRDG